MKYLLFVFLLLIAQISEAAWSSVGALMNKNTTTLGTSWAPVTDATLEAGNVGVCVISTDEATTGTTDGDNTMITSVTDAASNTWVKAGEFCNMQNSTALNGHCVDIWYTKAATQLNSGAAITIGFDATNTARHAATCQEFAFGVGSTIVEASGENGIANDAADPGALSCATGVNIEHLFIRGVGAETNTTTYTADTDYTGFTGQGVNSTADNGAAGSSSAARGEFRIATEATSATSDPTLDATDSGSYIIGLNEVAGSTRRIFNVVD